MLPPGNSRIAYETLCPSRAGNSTLVAFNTLKSETVLLGEKMTRKPVKVKKLPSGMVLGGTMKSVRMSRSPALDICMMAKIDIISVKTLKVVEDMIVIIYEAESLSLETLNWINML